MKWNFKYKFALVALAALAVSCGKDPEDNENDKQKRVLQAYITQYNAEHGTDIRPDEDGIIVMEHKMGHGDSVTPESFIYAYYDQLMLDGTYLRVSSPEKAKQLGTYSPKDYFGPSLFDMNDFTLESGFEHLFTKTREGSYIDAIIPPWLNTVESDGNTSNQTYDINLRYRFSIEKVIKDIEQYQIDTMEAYMDKYYHGADSIAKGFYFVKLHDAHKDTIPKQTVVQYRYIGKLLDGYIFDTNIADTAKKYNIYDRTRDYREGASITFMSTYQEMSSGNQGDIANNNGTEEGTTPGTSGSVIQGFARALKGMSYGDKAVTVFHSKMGYGKTGNLRERAGVPPYQPVVFYIYIDPKDNER